ncbi:hypothetical protein X975_03477, partial [Stegodyphus mimosarum]
MSSIVQSMAPKAILSNISRKLYQDSTDVALDLYKSTLHAGGQITFGVSKNSITFSCDPNLLVALQV